MQPALPAAVPCVRGALQPRRFLLLFFDPAVIYCAKLISRQNRLNFADFPVLRDLSDGLANPSTWGNKPVQNRIGLALSVAVSQSYPHYIFSIELSVVAVVG